MENCTPIDECLACGCDDLVLTLDLGTQPLANNFRDTAVTLHEKTYPLAVNRCTSCNHLQLTHAVNPAIIYTHYLYVSGTSQTNRDYMQWFAGFVKEQLPPHASSALDIGCNDGTQLNYLKDVGFSTYGVDPAENLWPTSSKNHNVVCGFWNEESAEDLGRTFDAIVAQNSFAHNPHPLEWLALAKELLNKDGKIFIQTSQADMVLNGEFDTIYHEHISFYNAESMRRLAERAGLHLVDVVKTPIHGNSYIFVLANEYSNEYRVANILDMERSQGLQSANTYSKWTQGVQQLLVELKETVDRAVEQDYHIIGYGAAAKGMTLLNASKIYLDAVVDDNPLKVGLWCPGTTIPVVNTGYIQQVASNEKIMFIPLAWNFYAEIVKRIRAVRTNENDVFLRYFPKIKVDTQ